MKKLILPNRKEGYIARGVYSIPILERKQYIDVIFKQINDDNLNKQRTESLRRLRGD